MQCEICGSNFLNSDEFNAHAQNHLLKGMEQFAPLLQEVAKSGSMGTPEHWAEAIAQRVAELVVARMPGPVFEARPVPKKSVFSFEEMQIAQIALMNNRSVDEVVALCRQAKEAMGQ